MRRRSRPILSPELWDAMRWALDTLPRRCLTHEVDHRGECAACGAVEGEACKAAHLAGVLAA